MAEMVCVCICVFGGVRLRFSNTSLKLLESESKLWEERKESYCLI